MHLKKKSTLALLQIRLRTSSGQFIDLNEPSSFRIMVKPMLRKYPIVSTPHKNPSREVFTKGESRATWYRLKQVLRRLSSAERYGIKSASSKISNSCSLRVRKTFGSPKSWLLRIHNDCPAKICQPNQKL